MNKPKTLQMCAYCGKQVEMGHWVYRGNVFCSGTCLLEFVGPSDSSYDEIVRLVQERMVHEIVHDREMDIERPRDNIAGVAIAREKVVPRAEVGVFSEANRFRSLDY